MDTIFAAHTNHRPGKNRPNDRELFRVKTTLSRVRTLGKTLNLAVLTRLDKGPHPHGFILRLGLTNYISYRK